MRIILPQSTRSHWNTGKYFSVSWFHDRAGMPTEGGQLCFDTELWHVQSGDEQSCGNTA